jgi:hypothetical protein
LTTWTLVIFLVYNSGGDLPIAATESMKIEFFTKDQCEDAKRDLAADLKETFRRYTLTCVKRPYVREEKEAEKKSSMKD